MLNHRRPIDTNAVPTSQILEQGPPLGHLNAGMVTRDERVFDRNLALRAATNHNLRPNQVELLKQESQPKTSQANRLPELTIPAERPNEYLPFSPASTPTRASFSWVQAKAEEVVRDVIRPIIESDGGTVSILQADQHSITLELGGACSGCPGLHYTKTRVIEPVLRESLGGHIQVHVQRARHNSLPPAQR